MTLKEKILQKLKLFLNLKYTNIFFDILRNITKISIEDGKKKKEKMYNKYFKERETNDIFFCFHKILKAMNQKEIYKSYYYSHLEISYLKNKAKLYYRKLNLIGIEVKKKTEFLIEYYIQLCKNELKQINQGKKIEEVKYKRKSKKLITYRSKSFGFHIEKKSKIEDEKKEENEEEEEEGKIEFEEEKSDMINIFIGKFDIKKILQKSQKFKIKKGEFVNAFIFRDSEKGNKNEQSNKVIRFISPKKKLDKNIISPVKTYIEQKNETMKLYLEQKTEPKIKKYNKHILIEESENETKSLFEKKLNMKRIVIDKNNSPLFTLNNHYPINKRNKYYLNQSSFYNKKPKTSRNNYLTRTIEINKSNNLPRIKSLFNKSRNQNKRRKDSSPKSLNFLSKNDLYY